MAIIPARWKVWRFGIERPFTLLMFWARLDPAVAPSESLYSQNPSLFRFNGPPLNEFQLHFLRKTVDMARQHGAVVVLLHMPSPSERGSDVVLERQLIPELLGPDVFLAGVPAARMFREVKDAAEFYDYFEDEHVNANGRELYTRAITPALVDIYERFSRTR